MGTAVSTIRNISHTSPYTLPLPGIYLLQGCLSGTCTWWSATAKSGSTPRTTKPLPATTTGWHHVASFSESFYAAAPRFFDQKNYGTRTDTARGHSFRLLRPISTPTENAPLARLRETSSEEMLTCVHAPAMFKAFSNWMWLTLHS